MTSSRDAVIRSVRPVDFGSPEPPPALPLGLTRLGIALIGVLPVLVSIAPGLAVLSQGALLLYLQPASVRPVFSPLLLALAACGWAVFQLLPFAPEGWTHTIWIMAGSAYDQPWRPRISIHPPSGWLAMATLLGVAAALVAGWAFAVRGCPPRSLLLMPLAWAAVLVPIMLLKPAWLVFLPVTPMLVVAGGAAAEWLLARRDGVAGLSPALAWLVLPGLGILAMRDGAALWPVCLAVAVVLMLRAWPSGRGGVVPAAAVLLAIVALGFGAGWLASPGTPGPAEVVALALGEISASPWLGLGLGAGDAALPMLRGAQPGVSLPPPSPLPSPLALVLGLGVPAALALSLAALLALLPAARAVLRQDARTAGPARVALAGTAGLLMLALMRPGGAEAGAVLLLAALAGAAGLPAPRRHGKPRTP